MVANVLTRFILALVNVADVYDLSDSALVNVADFFLSVSALFNVADIFSFPFQCQ